MVDLKENGKSVSVEPTLLRISDKLSLRYQKRAMAHLWSSSTRFVHSSSISERWRRFSQRSSPCTPWICRAMVTHLSTGQRSTMSPICAKASSAF